ncbi:hypothetical protein PR048_005693 [Dryococelus australis]|uniref:GST N-terminal domain-containing protein n=1 Tax=Dryococelus australis TaxID=614101 RepID=A0ABQ9IA42_9NEOP|nr:hypothetical protein PR048_005693 [Dryococelus australis]
MSVKLDIINYGSSNSNLARVTIAKQFQLPVYTLNSIVAKRVQFVQHSVAGQPHRKKLKISKYSKLEILLAWFQQKRALNILIHGRVIRQKAEEIAL